MHPTLPGVDVSAFADGLDFYETPDWVVDILIPKLPRRQFGAFHLVEPAAGRGAIVKRLAHHGVFRAATAIELHAGRFGELRDAMRGTDVTCIHGDFLLMDVEWPWWSLNPTTTQKLCVLNPPYSKPRKTIGLEFVERSLEMVGPTGFVAALLPLSFAETEERRRRIHDRYPGSLYPLSERADFGGDYGGGSAAYAWFTWNLADPRREWHPLTRLGGASA